MNCKKLILSVALAAVFAFGSVSLVACGSSSSGASSSSSAAATSQSASAGSQDNCYGDDLPKINK